MNQALAFGVLFTGGILLTKAVTGSSFADIVQGHPGAVSSTGQNLLAGGVSGVGQTVTGAASSASSGAAAGASVPAASWNPERKPIADWIVPVLQWASEHGWTGTVTSGYRSFSQQGSINASGAFSAPAGSSNHETTAYPGGAVDVTDPTQLEQVLKGYTGPEKLIGGVLGAVDPEHFSATGH